MPNFAKYFSFTAGSKDVFGEFVVDLYVWAICVNVSCRPWKSKQGKLGGHFGLSFGPFHFSVLVHPN